MMILAKHSDVGNKWVRIASFLPGRPENSVKNRYHSLLRRAMKGDQYPVATARKAGGTSFLAAIEAKLGGAAMRKAGGGASASAGGGSRAPTGGTKRRRSPTAAGGGRTSKMPDQGADSAAVAMRLQQAQTQAQQHAALQQLHLQAVMAGGGASGDMTAAALIGSGPYSVQDIAAATNAAIQAADGMGEKLAGMDTETQIAMIAAAMTGRAEVEPAVTEQLKRCRPIWTQFLHMQTAMAASQYGLGGYPMAFSMAPGLPTQGHAHPVSSMALLSAPPSGGAGGHQMHSALPASTASAAHTAAGMGQQKVIRDALGRDLSITIPPMAGVSGAASGAAGMGFHLAGPMSSSASPTFMFSPGNGNTPLNLVSMMHGGGLLSAQSRGDADGVHAAGTPTAFFMSASDGDGSATAQ